ncbi:MAG: carboxypeptidase regulatory-like domain-containing protein [Candidatus Methylacidiphilales bacterium]|nr:carboxypeptidase-like regulatory domain-containing protein [Candidatus Methylacidiphilales bacterium]
MLRNSQLARRYAYGTASAFILTLAAFSVVGTWQGAVLELPLMAQQAKSEAQMPILCVDQDGKPVAGAEVYLIVTPHREGQTFNPRKRVELDEKAFFMGPLKTDASGTATLKDARYDDKAKWAITTYARVPGKLAGASSQFMRKPGLADADSNSISVKMVPTMTVLGLIQAPEKVDVTQVKVTLRSWVAGPFDAAFSGTYPFNSPTNPRPHPWPHLVEFSPDAQGKVGITDVPVHSSLVLQANLPGYAEQTYSYSQPNGVSDKVPPFLMVMEREGILEGTVRNAEGKPVADVLVQGGGWSGSTRVTRYCKTDASGHYRIEQLPAAGYSVSVMPKDYDFVCSKAPKVIVKRGVVTSADINIEPGVWLYGQVLDKRTGEGIEKIAVGVAEGMNPTGFSDDVVFTDAKGEFKSKIPSTGRALTYIMGPYNKYLRPERMRQDVIREDGKPKPILFELSPQPAGAATEDIFATKPSVARGRVLDPAGKPLSGVEVTFELKKPSDPFSGPSSFLPGGSAITGKDGSYMLSLMPGVTCMIKAGGTTASIALSKPLDTTPDSQHTVEDLQVRLATARVAGRVLDQDGHPVMNMSISAGPKVSSYTVPYTARTDRDGRFVFHPLMDDQEIQFRTDGYEILEGGSTAPNNESVVIKVKEQPRQLPPEYN